ncbi:MAG: hypothetical protein RLZZ393_1977 [Pseudomonadota bacterium]
MSLRLRIILLLLAVLLPAFGGFAWIMTRNVQHAQDAFRAQVLSRAQTMRVSMDQELERRETVLTVLANSPALQEWNLPRFCQLARSAVAGSNDPIVLAREGRVVMGTSSTDCQPDPGRLQRVPEPLTSGRVHLTDLYTRSFGDRMMVLFSTLVHDGSIYELSIGVPPSALQETLELNGLEAGWSVTVLNPAGRVLARFPDPGRWVGGYGPDLLKAAGVGSPFWRAGIGPEQGGLMGRSGDGTLTHVVFSRANRYGLTVFITYPDSAVEASVHNTVHEEIFVAALLMLLGLSIAAWAFRQISAPATELRKSAEDLKAGRAVVMRRYGVPEFDSVASSLEDASSTIRSHNDELARRIDQAVEAARTSQLKLLQAQRLEVIGRLAGGIAHDFNNLLQTLSTGFSVLGQLVSDPRAAPLLEAGMRAVGRGSRLVQRLLAVGRSAPFEARSVDLAAQLSGMEVLLARALPRDIRLSIDFPPALGPVLTDAGQLEGALLNVVFNARDAMPQGGALQITACNASRDGRDGVSLRVADTGEGIPPELLPQVFEPFVTTKPVGRGTGLGLSQVKDFAQASGGSVGVESVVGKGTVVSLWLPRAVVAVAEEEALPASPPSVPGRRVLFVEDDALLSEVVSGALRNAGFEVRLCATADEALRRLRAGESVDVVFSDIVMSGTLSGLQLVDVLQQEFPALPVVLSTGYAQALPDPPPCVLLSKPYSIERLVDALNDPKRCG